MLNENSMMKKERKVSKLTMKPLKHIEVFSKMKEPTQKSLLEKGNLSVASKTRGMGEV